MSEPIKEITLTEEQQTALNKITEWQKLGHGEFKLGGYAGTGKTTMIKAVRKALKGTSAVCAFTGKAANVLSRKGIHDASTIHSLIYNVEPLKGGGVNFMLKSKYDLKVDLIIVDEASMISVELYNDLTSFDIPLLFIGDPGQLPPVGDNPNLMASPDYTLTQIHRQAQESPIIGFATDVRNDGSIYHRKSDDLIVRDKKLNMGDMLAHDQVICATNKTKDALNRKFRFVQGRPITQLYERDKIIVLRNNQSYSVFNGMLLTVTTLKADQSFTWIIDAEDEVGNKFPNLPIWKEPYIREMPKEFSIPKYKDAPVILSHFGYAITCHKAQGSEWDKVLVMDEYMPPQVWEMKRWRYTAITRAAKKLTYCI